MMRNTIKLLIIRYWYLLFLTVIILFMIMFRVSARELWGAIRSLSVWQLAILLSIYFVLSGLNILLRKYLLFSLGTRPRLKSLFAIHFTSMAAHYSTPAKLGFPVAILLLKQLEDIPYAVGTTTVLIELVVSTAVCGLIGVVGASYYFAEERFLIPFLAVTAIIISAVIIKSSLKHKVPRGRLGTVIQKLHDAIRLLSLRKLVIYAALRTFLQLCAGVNLFLLCIFFSTGISYAQAVVAGSSAFFAGSLSMVPMGLGVREGSVLFYLARFGVPGAAGISVVAVQRLISTGFTFLLGIITGSILGYRLPKSQASPIVKITSSG
jgi:uncharacterized protein (TIRG00374 family)